MALDESFCMLSVCWTSQLGLFPKIHRQGTALADRHWGKDSASLGWILMDKHDAVCPPHRIFLSNQEDHSQHLQSGRANPPGSGR